MLQQQSNNNNNHDDNMSSAVASPTSSSPPASTSLTSSRMNRKQPVADQDHDEEDSNSSLIVNNFSEDSSLVNLCFSKEIETLRSQLKTQVRWSQCLKMPQKVSFYKWSLSLNVFSIQINSFAYVWFDNFFVSINASFHKCRVNPILSLALISIL